MTVYTETDERRVPGQSRGDVARAYGDARQEGAPARTDAPGSDGTLAVAS